MWLQDVENPLLEQALAMSMNISASGHSLGDAEMIESTTEDKELALGMFSVFYSIALGFYDAASYFFHLIAC